MSVMIVHVQLPTIKPGEENVPDVPVRVPPHVPFADECHTRLF